MEFYSPLLLFGLAVLPILAFLRYRKKVAASVRFSSLIDLKNAAMSFRSRMRFLPVLIRFSCIALLIIAVARPREGTEFSNISTEGVAMQVLVDLSSSMSALMDFGGQKLDRLEVSKLVLEDFIGGGDKFEGRAGDLIGLITFARYADTICPLVHGHSVLLEFIKKTRLVTQGSSEDGTAIGDAIALAAARLKRAEDEITERNNTLQASGEIADGKKDDEFKIKSKVIVLLTDGMQTAGDFDPVQAAKLAKEWGIKIYTIGITSPRNRNNILSLIQSQDINEPVLKNIAAQTGGFYARATNGEQLLNIYKKIDKLEKTEIKSVQYTQFAERFGSWALAALILLTLEIFASCTIFRKVP